MTSTGRIFENEALTLDNNEFVGCIFRNCTIRYNGGPWSAPNSTFEGQIVWEFGEAAVRTIELLYNFNKLSDEFSKEIDRAGLKDA